MECKWNQSKCKKKACTIGQQKDNPDIFCVQETKAWPEQLDDSLLNIGEYKSYFAQGIKRVIAEQLFTQKKSQLM